MGNLKITLVKSTIGTKPKQKLNVKALGLNKTNSFVIQKDNEAIRGIINKISHLVKVEQV